MLGDRAHNILLQKRFEKLAPTEVLKGQIEENKTKNDLSYHLKSWKTWFFHYERLEAT